MHFRASDGIIRAILTVFMFDFFEKHRGKLTKTMGWLLVIVIIVGMVAIYVPVFYR